MPDGVVIEVDGPEAQVSGPDGVVRCTLPGKWRVGGGATSHPVAVGDEVRYRTLQVGVGVLEKVSPRRTKLSRPVAGGRAVEQVVVANVDQVLIVVAAARPRPKQGLVDRILVAALRGEIRPVVCVNKVDLVPQEKILEKFGHYRDIGLTLLLTSVPTREGLDDLREILHDRKTVFAGPSGAGKSSLLNLVLPGAKLRTGEVSDKTSKGKHVTSRVTLIPLEGGGYVVDTPGVRMFGLWGTEPTEVQGAFPDILEASEGCRFGDCLHRIEPHCAVRKAVEEGGILKSRHDSYLRILASMKEV
ncbi:MAG: ribosome small subunit-dependent GTPase A [Planctomycetota bacterium]|nr:ribosome small subunit-dependent GTPase A [Planctomycetota bacterium]